MKIPKDVGGVEIPGDLRRMAKKLVHRIDSPVGKDAAVAGLTLAAAAVIAISGQANSSRPEADDDAPDAPLPPEPPTPPQPPLRTAERVTPAPRGPSATPISPAQAQAVTDALGNVAEAALGRFLGGRRGS